MNSFYEDGRRTAGDDGQHIAPEAVRLEAKLLEHALAADAQCGQHRRVERAGEEEGRRGVVELVDLRAQMCRLLRIFERQTRCCAGQQALRPMPLSTTER